MGHGLGPGRANRAARRSGARPDRPGLPAISHAWVKAGRRAGGYRTAAATAGASPSRRAITVAASDTSVERTVTRTLRTTRIGTLGTCIVRAWVITTRVRWWRGVPMQGERGYGSLAARVAPFAR